MKSFLQRRIITPIRQLLLSGITPQKIALSMACGIVVGVFPVMGTTTILCTLIAVTFGLNLPATQLVNYFIYPAQLLLIVPFIRIGEFILRIDRTQLSLSQMVALFRANQLQALHMLWKLALHGIVAWMLIAPFIFFILYRIFLFAITRLASEISRRRQSNTPFAETA